MLIVPILANLFPGVRSTVLTFFVGCFDSSSSVLVYFQMIYDQGIAGLFTISLVYVALGVFVLIRSVSLTPTKTVPHDMPNDYTLFKHSILQKLRNRNTVDSIEKLCY